MARETPTSERQAFNRWLETDYSPDRSGATSEADEKAFIAVLFHVWQARANLGNLPDAHVEELIASVKEVLRISDRDHEAWNRAKAAIKLSEEKGSSLQLRNLIRQRHAQWSDTTFGSVGAIGPLKHLSKEALEAAAEPDDLSEWADLQFLLWDAQRRAGISDGEITAAMEEKLKVNMARQWPEPKDGEPRLHIKEPGTLTNEDTIQQDWIKCSERMPEEEGPYLALDQYSTVWTALFDEDEDLWPDTKFERKPVFTHWMPLPAAPKQGER